MMWEWLRRIFLPEARVHTDVTEVSTAVHELHKQQSEEIEARVCSAVAEANAIAHELHKQQREEIEARVCLAVAEASAIAHELHKQQCEEIEARVQLGVAQAIAHAENRADETANQLRDMRQHLPAFLNVMSTVPALAHTIKRLEDALIEGGADRKKLWEAAAAANRAISELRSRIDIS